MRKIGMLFAFIAVSACDGGNGSGKGQADIDTHEGKATNELELRASYEAKRQALTLKAQGCPGRVLRGRELKNAVAGKIDRSPTIPPLSRIYHLDGTLDMTGTYAKYSGHYWVSEDQLCHDQFYDGDRTKWCVRLIQTGNTDIMEEVLDVRDSEKIRLGCTSLQLQKFGKNK